MRVAAIVLAVAACSGGHEQTATLELVDPGAEPRTQLRYTFDELERDIAFVSVFDDKPQATFGDMRYRVTCERGRCRYQMVKFEVLGRGEDFEQMKKHVHGTIRLPASGPVGITPGSAMRTTPATPDLMRAAIVPFPDQRVGVGARWASIEGGERRTFQLVKNDGRALTIETAMTSANDAMKVEQRGQLRVSLADPFAKGTFKVVQTMKADPSIQMDEHATTLSLTID